MTAQYPMPLVLPDDYSRARFHVSACNNDALALVERFPQPGQFAAVIVGPKASGKTHLAHIWAARIHAKPFNAIDPLAPLAHPVVVDNAENCDANSLFHLLNNAKASGHAVVLTCTERPAVWSALPDLTSRLNSVETVMLELPDEEALAGVLQKYFADQQLNIAPEVINYLTPRMDRSFQGARNLAEKLNLLALSEKRAITVPLARRLFNEEVSPIP